MEGKYMQGWLFMRSGAMTQSFGTVRFTMENDTPLNDHRIYEPGWVRCPSLDTVVPPDDTEITLNEKSEPECKCHPGTDQIWRPRTTDE